MEARRETTAENNVSKINLAVNEKIDEVGCFYCYWRQSCFLIHEYGAELKYIIKFSTHSTLDANNKRILKLFRSERNAINAADIHLCYECSHRLVIIKIKMKPINKSELSLDSFGFYGQIHKFNGIMSNTFRGLFQINDSVYGSLISIIQVLFSET